MADVALTLHVDGTAWRAHAQSLVAATPGLVPVIKGNGYGFGHEVLARVADSLAVDTVAVGTSDEVQIAESHFGRDVLVLQPWHPDLAELPDVDPRVLRTVSSLDALRAMASTEHRLVVELRTAMARHGVEHSDLPEVLTLLDTVSFEGFSLHLPLAGDVDAEVDAVAGRVAGHPLWVSHLVGAAYERARRRHPEVDFRTRVGTALWLGDRATFRVTSTVLDVHRMRRGSSFGYRQRTLRHDATLLVLSGGTSSGIGLEAPKPVSGILVRTKIAANAGLAVTGHAMSPFTVAGKQRWFAEPPHMQVSMVLLPADVPAPVIGDEVAVDVRMTTTTFDRIVGL